MSGAGLPTDLSWREFERVLRKLGYVIFKAGPGSARTYRNPQRKPEFATFHEPHKRGLALGTLRMYVRNLELERDEFMELLNS